MRSIVKFLLYAGGSLLIYSLTYYICESVVQSIILTGIFGFPLLLCAHVVLSTLFPGEFDAPLNLKQATGEALKDMASNFLFLCVVFGVLFLIWKVTYQSRAQVLKDISIMLQPENQSEAYWESPKGRKKMAQVCYFAVAAYRVNAQVLVDWEIKAIRSMCMASEDAKMIEEMEKVLPTITDKIEFEDDSLAIDGTSADQTAKTGDSY